MMVNLCDATSNILFHEENKLDKAAVKLEGVLQGREDNPPIDNPLSPPATAAAQQTATPASTPEHLPATGNGARSAVTASTARELSPRSIIDASKRVERIVPIEDFEHVVDSSNGAAPASSNGADTTTTFMVDTDDVAAEVLPEPAEAPDAIATLKVDHDGASNPCGVDVTVGLSNDVTAHLLSPAGPDSPTDQNAGNIGSPSGSENASGCGEGTLAPAGGEDATGKIRGIRGVHQMNNSKYGKRFQVRVWLKRGEFIPKSTILSKRSKKQLPRSGGKRIHLGCFGSLKTATHAFDIVEIFFRGDKSQTNLPISTYRNAPVLHFLLNTVKNKRSIDDFLIVWKHIMPFRWVMDATEPSASVMEQLTVVSEKLERYNARSLSQEEEQVPSTLNAFLQLLASEQQQNAIEHQAYQHHPDHGLGQFMASSNFHHHGGSGVAIGGGAHDHHHLGGANPLVHASSAPVKVEHMMANPHLDAQSGLFSSQRSAPVLGQGLASEYANPSQFLWYHHH